MDFFYTLTFSSLLKFHILNMNVQVSVLICAFSFASPGLIDYNFHCFRKAIHEVFEVGVSTQRLVSPQVVGSPCSKVVALNGTPRNTV